jgi:LacI family transcriptional regulator
MSITQVAKLAGVSSSTVSRVINNHPRVAPETEKSVRKAMQELGYVPSDRRPGPKPLSRLKTETRNVSFLVLGASDGQATPAFAELLRGVSMGATDQAVNLAFHYVPNPDQLPTRALEQGVDGLLLHGNLPGVELERKLRKLPTVWLMGNRRRPEWGDQVMPDAYEVGHLAAEYLIHQSHRRLAFLNLDANHWPLRVYFQSFSATAASFKVPVDSVQSPLETTGNYWGRHSPKVVEALVQKFLDLPQRPTGIFVADDMQVALLQPALQARGVEIGPGAAQVISCNNETPFLVGLQPRPAVIDIRVQSIGRRAVEHLLWRMTNQTRVQERIITAVEPYLVGPQGAVAPTRADGQHSSL